MGAAIGAIDIFLLQSLLTAFNVSTYVLQVAYGTILVAAVMLTAVQERLSARRAVAMKLDRDLLASTNGRIAGAFAVAAAAACRRHAADPGYSAPFAIRAILVLAALLAVASIGQTLVVILGGIDLSIPFVIGFANVVAAPALRTGLEFRAGLRGGRRAFATHHRRPERPDLAQG